MEARIAKSRKNTLAKLQAAGVEDAERVVADIRFEYRPRRKSAVAGDIYLWYHGTQYRSVAEVLSALDRDFGRLFFLRHFIEMLTTYLAPDATAVRDPRVWRCQRFRCTMH